MFIKCIYRIHFTPSRACQIFERFESSTTRPLTLFKDVERGPPDAILSINEAYEQDTCPEKVNLSIGAYRDDAGEPWVLPSVQQAKECLLNKKMIHEYGPILGLPDFCNAAAKLAFGEKCTTLLKESNATMQTVSGTGALSIGAQFLNKFWKNNREVYLPKPTWDNHANIFAHTTLKVKWYRYFDKKRHGLDYAGFMEDICKMPKGSIILLHACAHNPTGVDPHTEQWCEISHLIKEHNHYPFFDMAYQGFATGDVDRDAFAVRHFELENHQLFLAQSFAKNMGLYGERVGACTFICSDKDEAERVLSQAKIIIRSMYSTPPLYGARIANEILKSPELYQLWQHDLRCMSNRLTKMRKALKDNLEKLGSKLCWDRITSHIGMFCYTGLTSEQVDTLARDYHIYMARNGRISIAGINTKNVEYVAGAIHSVTS